MAIETLERVRTTPPTLARAAALDENSEPNFGPSDMHAIKVIACLMNGIFVAALAMYGTIALFIWLGS